MSHLGLNTNIHSFFYLLCSQTGQEIITPYLCIQSLHLPRRSAKATATMFCFTAGLKSSTVAGRYFMAGEEFWMSGSISPSDPDDVTASRVHINRLCLEPEKEDY